MTTCYLHLIFVALLLGCGGGDTNRAKTVLADDSLQEEEEFVLAPDHSFYYDLEKPDTSFEMPNKLLEISGLGIDILGNYLYAVQDEDGDVFMINTQNGEVEQKVKFHKSGDYEGVEWVEGRVFVVKSTGTLYEVSGFNTPEQQRIKYKFSFHDDIDVEGLGYDYVDNRLLISSKGKAGKGEEFNLKKGIFAFDLDSLQFSETPVYEISMKEVKDFLEVHPMLERIDKLMKLFSPEEEFVFGPSGIAVHPLTGEIYVISSVGKLLVVLNRDGSIENMIKLKKKIHAQPEGIVFDSRGNLYISNEGKREKGIIYRFDYQIPD